MTEVFRGDFQSRLHPVANNNPPTVTCKGDGMELFLSQGLTFLARPWGFQKIRYCLGIGLVE